MLPQTKLLIEAVLCADNTITPEKRQAILNACDHDPQPQMINARQAMEILGVTRPTLRKYVLEGKLHETKLSQRKTRFSLWEVNDFARGA